MTVHRLTPLPICPARGKLVVSSRVLSATQLALQRFVGADAPHEGLVYWAGRIIPPYTYAFMAIVPACDHGPFRVIANEAAIGHAARVARGHGVGLVAQVHSHPGTDTRHSDGDDQLVLMPFDGMFSLVVGSYGRGGILPTGGAGLHQFQDRRWVQIAAGDDAIIVTPELEVLDG